MIKFKLGGLYSMEKFPIPRQQAGKCKYCSCPVIFTPTLEIIGDSFKVTRWKTYDSKGERHHCLKYKMSIQ